MCWLSLRRCRRALSVWRPARHRIIGHGNCRALGHRVRLMPPAYGRPYVKRQKNDATDAEAICEAVTGRICGSSKLTYKGDCFDDSLAALISCRLKLDWQVPSRFARDHSCALARMAKRLGLQSARQ